MPDMVDAIKQAALDAWGAQKPADFMFGKVTSTSPLKILVEQRLELSGSQLCLTRNVADYSVSMTMDHATGSALGTYTHNHSYSGSVDSHSGTSGNGGEDTHNHTINHGHTYSGSTGSDSYALSHSHSYSGTKTFKIHNGLQAGEKVILLRKAGGQQFLVLDRVV